VFAFTGRAAELDGLDAMLLPARASGASADIAAPVISVVCGSGGVGKTALAVHWAHRVADRFPDGQLYLDLRGAHPDEPLSPDRALAALLGSLGVTGADLPAALADRSARYRSLLSGRRMLVLLDNALNAAQVRPLLPGTASCRAVVTSRDSMAGLVARDGARRHRLDVLPADDARRLLDVLIGARAGGEPAAAAALVRLCAHLPLALRIAADLVTARPGTSLADLAAELAGEPHPATECGRLDLLDAGADDDTAVRTVFSWSERHLPPAASRFFWLLGLHPGRAASAGAAAALAGVDTAEARRLLDTLARAHLVDRAGPDRWSTHDLLRDFACERACERIPAADRQVALTGLFEHYLSRAVAATHELFPEQRLRPDGGARPAAAGPVGPTGARPAAGGGFVDAEQALAWLDAERPNLVAVARTASGPLAGYAVDIARTIALYLQAGYHNADAFAINERALAVARAGADRGGLALALFELGRAHCRSERYTEAAEQTRRALRLYRDLGDRNGEARCHASIGGTELHIGRYAVALARQRKALALFRETGDRPGEARAVASIGRLHWHRGRHREAMRFFDHAAAMYAAMGDRVGQGRLLNDLGNVYQRQRRFAEARDCHERAGRLLHEVGDCAAEACSMTDLGRIHSMCGRHREALDHFAAALDVFRRIGDRVGEAEVLIDRGDAYQRLGSYEKAHEAHRAAMALAIAIGERRLQAHALNGQGRARCFRRPAEALALHRAAYKFAVDIGERDCQARALDGMAVAHAAAGHEAQARRHWARALEIYGELDLPEAGEVRTRLRMVG
jgi:tetratricopeptide (TPR) repeat protein